MRFKAFRTRFSATAASDPLGVLAGLQRREDMQATKKATCPECGASVLRLRSATRGHVLVDEPRDDQVARGPAVIVGEDGLARELREGQAPLDGQRAFTQHATTCTSAKGRRAAAAIERMQARQAEAAL